MQKKKKENIKILLEMYKFNKWIYLLKKKN